MEAKLRIEDSEHGDLHGKKIPNNTNMREAAGEPNRRPLHTGTGRYVAVRRSAT